MSVIVRDENKKIKLYCKGADTAIFERVSAGSRKSLDFVKEALEQYASFGYRTLCFASKEIDESVYSQWSPKFKKAEIEKEMRLIGATAIEDKLQEYVPETIQALMAADIHVWMLTGDKRETAINIAHSCALCNNNTELLIVDKATYDDTYHKLVQFVDRAKELEQQQREFAMVIDGKSLVHALTGEAREYFGQLALLCRSVVCCRMSPMQKAEVVDLVRKLGDHVVLAIGDGANDVAMIQAANVGIGISGEEGLQAASASDYAIAQFHFLRRLLLVHGSWDYDRSVKVILYSFYKNICLYIIELWFAFFSAWSGQTIFERWTIGMFNVIFTAWPPLIIGLFDRPINDDQMLRFPALYYSFQKRAFTMDKFAGWIGLAIYHSLVLYFLTYFFLDTGVAWSNGRTGGWLMLGNCTYTFVVVTVCLKAILETDSWTYICGAFCLISIVSWFLLIWIYSLFFPTLKLGADMAGMFYIMCSSPSFWLMLIFIPTTTLLADLIIKSVMVSVYPTPREQAVLMQKRHGFERLTREANSQSHKAVHPTLEQMQNEIRETPQNEILSDRNQKIINTKQQTGAIGGFDNLAADYGSIDNIPATIRSQANLSRWLSTVCLITYSVIDFMIPTRFLHSSPLFSFQHFHLLFCINGIRLSSHASMVSRHRMRDRLSRHSESSMALQEQTRHGYAFSQEEEGPVQQTDLIRNIDSTRGKPSGR
ncbi:unnamed protein product, partial [Mesorhabditis belari]|uniref:Phospholipid-transporting ATPase n=1 Tax=Mesorhabditis belari TaxID=2138241 RepID=A0AAF3FER1_9BILA